MDEVLRRMDGELLMTADVAKLAGVTGEAVRAWERHGKLRAIRTLSGVRLYYRAQVQAFITERMQVRTRDVLT
jgi:DNA-binding transcriptional MerR regulator